MIMEDPSVPRARHVAEYADDWLLSDGEDHEQEVRLLQWLRERRESGGRTVASPASTQSLAVVIDLASNFVPDKLGAALSRLWSIDGTSMVLASHVDAECCPITLEPMESPVLAADGFVYEEAAITRWMQESGRSGKSPCTNLPFEHRTLVKLAPLANAVHDFLENCQRSSEGSSRNSRCRKELDGSIAECINAAEALPARNYEPGFQKDLQTLEASILRATALSNGLRARIAEAQAIAFELRQDIDADRIAEPCWKTRRFLKMTMTSSFSSSSSMEYSWKPGADEAAQCIQRWWRQTLRRRRKQERRKRVTDRRRNMVHANSNQMSANFIQRTARSAVALRVWRRQIARSQGSVSENTPRGDIGGSEWYTAQHLPCDVLPNQRTD